jgi:hypothetical protein
MFVTNFRRPRPRGPKEIHHRMQKHPRQLQPCVLARPNRGPVPARTSSMVELRSAVRSLTPRPGAGPHRKVRELRDPNEAPDEILRNHTGRRRASRRLHHKKKLLATRIAPHITKAEFNGFCRMWLRDGHHLLEEPRHATNDVVPSAPFVGEPAPRHHERPHQPRDQKPVEHQTLDEPRFNEEDAPQDTTTGDAAGVLPQEAGGLRHAQDVHRDRCTQPLLKHERGETTTATVRPEDVPTRLIDQKRDGDLEIPNAEQHPQQEPAERSGQSQPEPECFEPKKPPAEPAERSGQPEPEPERFEPKTPPEKPPAEPAERSGKQLDDNLQLPAAETTAEKHPQRQGKLALSAALPSEPGSVPGQLPKVVAVISTRPHRADRQQQPRPPQPQYDPAPRRCQPRLLTPGAQHAQEKPPREQPPDAERRHQLRLPLPQQDSAVQQRQQRSPEPGARSKPLRRPPEAG